MPKSPNPKTFQGLPFGKCPPPGFGKLRSPSLANKRKRNFPKLRPPISQKGPPQRFWDFGNLGITFSLFGQQTVLVQSPWGGRSEVQGCKGARMEQLALSQEFRHGLELAVKLQAWCSSRFSFFGQNGEVYRAPGVATQAPRGHARHTNHSLSMGVCGFNPHLR